MAPPGLMESRRGTPVGPPSKSIDQIERELDTARGRREFFSNRPDVSDDRALRRMKQADELQRFKNLYTKPVQGSSNLLQMKQGAPRSLAKESMRLANQYGPTFREIGSDIGYGLGSIGRGIGDFIGRGGVIGSVLSDLFGRVRSGAQQGIETVGGLYDNLRKTLGGGEPTVTYGGSSDMTVTEEPTFVSPTIDNQKIYAKQLQGLLPPSKQGDDTFRDEYPFLYDSRLDNLPFKAKPNVSDQNDFETALANARVDNLGLPSLTDLYNFGKNPELKTNVGNFRFDNVLSGNPQLGYGNTFMVNGLPVDLNATIGQGGLNFGASMNFKKGGSVDKYAGLGYKLR